MCVKNFQSIHNFILIKVLSLFISRNIITTTGLTYLIHNTIATIRNLEFIMDRKKKIHLIEGKLEKRCK